jgi:hypothetical protein
MQEMQKVSIESLSNGAATERFNLEFQKVLENILDPNTTATLQRQVNLTLKIKPSDNREFAQVEIHTSSKLAPITEHITQVFIGKDIRGRAEASERVQQSLFPDMEPSNIIKMEGTNR